MITDTIDDPKELDKLGSLIPPNLKDKVQKIVIKPEKVDIKTFNDYAVFLTNDCSEIYVARASIGKPTLTKCYGVIPNNSKGRFNCCVGNYTDQMCTIRIQCNLKNAGRIFGASEIWATEKNIFTKTVSVDQTNVLLANDTYNVYYGFFKNKMLAFDAINKKRREYMDELSAKSRRILPCEDIDKYLENYGGTYNE